MKQFAVLVAAILVAVIFTTTSYAQILIEEDDRPIQQSRTASMAAIQYSDGMAFRSKRKVGFGVNAAGDLGLVGLNLELNFTPETSFIGGFGYGDGFQAFKIQIKNVIGGKWFMPYFAMGYARWFTVGDNNPAFSERSPVFLGDRFLNNDEKQKGSFAKDLIYPTLGIQYVQLKGDWTGTSIYAEILLLTDVDDFVSAATGAVGMTYYF